MEAFFICTNCHKLVASVKMEEHYHKCLDAKTQKMKQAFISFGGTDRDEKDVRVDLDD